MSSFDKYERKGAYHWDATLAAGRFEYNPRLAARYTVALRLLEEHVDLSASQGVDIGCGDGVLLEYLRKRGASTVGIDFEKECLNLYGKYSYDPCPVVQGDVYNLPLSNRCFDFVTMLDVIEHFSEPERALQQARSLLKRGGVLVLTTPFGPDEDGSYHDEEHHEEEYRPEGLQSLLSSVFDTVEVNGYIPSWIDSLYKDDWTVRPVMKGIRGLFKAISYHGFNPYVEFGVGSPETHHDQLVGVAVRD
ncbi:MULTISPECIES: class I SAM-dependent methyltransferase [Salinibaculum]|uniref:class I SAM-dependent methyltransferase n=1 Tax=Salinibaculum TaxID=2732368 RepID=UPI0030D090F1